MGKTWQQADMEAGARTWLVTFYEHTGSRQGEQEVQMQPGYTTSKPDAVTHFFQLGTS